MIRKLEAFFEGILATQAGISTAGPLMYCKFQTVKLNTEKQEVDTVFTSIACAGDSPQGDYVISNCYQGVWTWKRRVCGLDMQL